MTRRSMRSTGLAVLCLGLSISLASAKYPPDPRPDRAWQELDHAASGLIDELRDAAIRLPLAAALGAVLALRPRRRGLPGRRPVVVQTQVALAVVGGVIMLVVGASLARAFGIMGVAGLIRYRAKIDDPKDAVVMLSALAVGLAAGSGLLALATFSTFFLVATLATIEHFEPRTRVFELSVKLGEYTAPLRPQVEAVLRQFEIQFELRGTSEESVVYRVATPFDIGTDLVTKALTALVPDGKCAVEWTEKASRRPK